jgi:hypothetical protein
MAEMGASRLRKSSIFSEMSKTITMNISNIRVKKKVPRNFLMI